MDKIVGNYRLLSGTEPSGSGVLYRAESNGGNRKTLLLLLSLTLPAEALRPELHAATRILATLDRPNLAAIRDAANSSDGRLCLVFDDLDAHPIPDLLLATEQPRPTERALTLIGHLASMLGAGLSANLIHQLLLPHYVLVSDTGPPYLLGLDLPITLTDALISNLSEEELAFLSPEQREGKVCDTRSNIYSLGALLVYLLTGDAPVHLVEKGWDFTPFRSRQPDLTDETLRLVATCLQPEGWMRFQSYESLQSALALALAAESPTAKTEESPSLVGHRLEQQPVELTRDVRTPSRRLPQLQRRVSLLIMIVIAIVAGGTWLLFGADSPDPSEITPEVGPPTAAPSIGPTRSEVNPSSFDFVTAPPRLPPSPTSNQNAVGDTPQSEQGSAGNGLPLATTTRMTSVNSTAPAGVSSTREWSDFLRDHDSPIRQTATRVLLPQVLPSATNPPPEPSPTASPETPLPPPAPQTTATQPPSPTAEPIPTTTPPLPGEEPPTTATPPLP